jgi:glycosyltransferase involved in cell wall biosynthesis
MTTVLNVLFEERIGGPQLRVLQVAEQALRLGFRTIVAIPKGDPMFAKLLDERGIPCEQLELVRLRHTQNLLTHARFAAHWWPNVSALRTIIRKHRVDVVHTNGLLHLQAAIAARLENVALVWHLNDVNSALHLKTIFLPIVRSLSHQVAVAARAVGRFYFPDPWQVENRLQVLYAPVDVERFNPGKNGDTARHEFGTGGDPLIGTVANLSPGKGCEFLIEAIPLIRRHFPQARFVIVGEMLANRESYWQSLIQRVDELAQATHVRFVGRIDAQDMPCLMREFTIYVHPSEFEACPMAVLEASASGVPVIATDVGGTNEIVVHGETGFLVRPRSPQEISDSVIRLLNEPAAAHALGEAGAARMKALFSLERCVEAHVRVYTAALQGCREARPARVAGPPSRSRALHNEQEES